MSAAGILPRLYIIAFLAASSHASSKDVTAAMCLCDYDYPAPLYTRSITHTSSAMCCATGRDWIDVYLRDRYWHTDMGKWQ